MGRTVGLIGTQLAGKTSIASILGTSMKLSERLSEYLPSLLRKIDVMIDLIREIAEGRRSIGNLRVQKSSLEGLLEMDMHYKTMYLEELKRQGINPEKIRETQLYQYASVLALLRNFIQYEIGALSSGSPMEEVRNLGDIKVKIYPGQVIEKNPKSEDIYDFIRECDGRIVWVLSPRDLYAIVDYVKEKRESAIIDILKSIERRIDRKRVYFIITKVDNIARISGNIVLTDNIEVFRGKVIIGNEGPISKKYLQDLLKGLYKEVFDEGLAKKVISKVFNLLDIHEIICRAIEEYSLFWYCRYALNKKMGGILYTSAEERRNVEECLKFLRKVEGGKLLKF